LIASLPPWKSEAELRSSSISGVVLDVPQVGSFEGKTGSFYARDTYEQKDIIVQFRWDANNATPVWSQAFSPDNGQTWEWNWYMTFHREDAADEQ
jgi:hypothetical protein